MQWIDVFFLAVIGGFAFFGVWFGFFHTLGSLLGTVFGVYLASRFYEPAAAWMIGATGWGMNVSRVVVFTVAFLIINRLVGFVFWIVDKFLSVITRLPFLSSLNRILGLLLGIAEGAITLGIIIYFIERFPVSDRLMQVLATSVMAPGLSALVSILLPLLPDALRLLQSSVDYVSTRAVEFATSTAP